MSKKLGRATTMEVTAQEGQQFLEEHPLSSVRACVPERYDPSIYASVPSSVDAPASPTSPISSSPKKSTASRRSKSKSKSPARKKKVVKEVVPDIKKSPVRTVTPAVKYAPSIAPVVKRAPAAPAAPESYEDELAEFVKTRKLQYTGPDSGATEVVFSFDTTGSMGAAIQQAKDNIRDLTERLFTQVPNIRIGVIAHGDYCDAADRVMQVFDLSGDKAAIVSWIASVKNGGGGDAPENYEEVLEYVQSSISWSPGSRRVLVMIGDSYPHPPAETLEQMTRYNRPNPRAIDWKEQVDLCHAKGIKIYGIKATSRSAHPTEYFYRSMAARTAGTYLQLDSFGMVTDMLLMVCYREGNERAFEEFRSEVEAAGRMCADRAAMFDALAPEVAAA